MPRSGLSERYEFRQPNASETPDAFPLTLFPFFMAFTQTNIPWSATKRR
jgi:hypothetical protein